MAESRRLRDEVRHLRGCLGVLPELDRHLIEMRAGVDGPAMTRRAAAKQLHIGVGRAHAIERKGLRTMRRAARAGTCGGGSSSSPSSGFHTYRAVATTAPAAVPVAAVGATPAASASTPAAAHLPASGSPPDVTGKQHPQQGVLGAKAASPGGGPPAVGGRVASATPHSGRGLVIALVLLLLAANLLAGGVWLLRRRAERGDWAVDMGRRRRRVYGDPNTKLDFGGAERPERPERVEEHARSDGD